MILVDNTPFDPTVSLLLASAHTTNIITPNFLTLLGRRTQLQPLSLSFCCLMLDCLEINVITATNESYIPQPLE